MMIIEKVVVGYLETNCYLFFDSVSQDTFIIDPGADADLIQRHVKKLSLLPRAIINTHGHIDHIGADEELKRRYRIPIYIHRDDENFFRDPTLNGSVFFADKSRLPVADVLLSGGEEIAYGPLRLNVIHTPGHTPGGICLLSPGILFTGDTLFRGSVGRCDLPGGNEGQLMESMAFFGTLPPETTIYPGHGEQTSVGEELSSNPFLQG